MKMPCLWHGGYGNWDCAFPRFVLDRAADCEHLADIALAPQLPQSAAVICVPARHSTGDYARLNEAAANFDRMTFILFGDEEGIFHADRLEHTNKKVWWFMPPMRPKQEVDRVAVNGWPIDCREIIAEEKSVVAGVRDFDWCFAGQMTHIRRIQCVDATQTLQRGFLLPTRGFTEGMHRKDYYRILCRSKVALCPSGPCTPDSFRFAEALEANCIPIADDLTQHADYPSGYWKYVFGYEDQRLPFPIIKDWSTLPDVLERILLEYVQYFTSCAGFWSGYKLKLIEWMREDLNR